MKFEMYADASGKSRWRLKANNGQIVADSGEGYHSPGNVRRAIKNFKESVRDAKIVVGKDSPRKIAADEASDAEKADRDE